MSLFGRPRQEKTLRAEAIEPTRRQLLSWGCACCAAAALPVSARAAQSPAVQQHLLAARQAAGSDLLAYLKLGEVAAPPAKPTGLSIDELMALPAPPPGRVFDNLYFVGSKWVSTWAITTSDGIILIDAMDNDEEAQRIVDGGMQKLGLDPRRIKLIVVTHGHGDHYGGCGYLTQRYGARVVMSDADWTMMETKLEFDRPDWGRPPKRDLSVNDGGTVKLGNTSLDVIITPGHTMGTITLLFDVAEGATKHRAMLWGGTAFNFGRQPNRVERLQAYIDATGRAKEIATRQGVDVFISNHNGYDEAVEKIQKLKAGGPNPFVIGEDATQRALTVMQECALATMAVWSA